MRSWLIFRQYMHDVAEEPGENDVSSEGSDEDSEEESDEEEESDAEGDEVDEIEQRARNIRLGNTETEDAEDEDDVPELHDHGAKRTVPAAPSSVAARSHMTARTNLSRTTQGSRTSRTSEGSDLKSIVAGDLARQRQRSEGKHHTRKGLSSAGRAKGSKWKDSASAQVGRNAAQGGIWN